MYIWMNLNSTLQCTMGWNNFWSSNAIFMGHHFHEIFIQSNYDNFQCLPQRTQRGRSQTTLTSFWLFLKTYPPSLTVSTLSKLTFSNYLPTSSCKRSLWTTPNQKCIFLFPRGCSQTTLTIFCPLLITYLTFWTEFLYCFSIALIFPLPPTYLVLST